MITSCKFRLNFVSILIASLYRSPSGNLCISSPLKNCTTAVNSSSPLLITWQKSLSPISSLTFIIF
nr:MAG TPA: hypothetical protein [Caudoviricetes sp.]